MAAPKPFKIRCDHCGRAFDVFSINIRYCSTQCTIAAEREMKICKICGCRFVNARGARRSAYCSDDCEKEATRRQHRKWMEKNPAPKAEHPTVQCERCGKEFVRKKPDHKYCSEDCQYQAKLERMRKEPKETPPPVIDFRDCAFCGQTYDHNDAEARGDYCSERCRKKAKEKAARQREIAKLQKQKKKLPPVAGCLWCGEHVEVKDGKFPKQCPSCGKPDFEWLRRCHDCGEIVPDGSYRCDACRRKMLRGADKFDAGADGYGIAL